MLETLYFDTGYGYNITFFISFYRSRSSFLNRITLKDAFIDYSLLSYLMFSYQIVTSFSRLFRVDGAPTP